MIKNPACDRKISTIDLEFVRPGPPHNQLLSPLTEYLALCGDFQTMSLRVPWEHGQFMRRLQELRYPGGNQDLVRRQGGTLLVPAMLPHLVPTRCVGPAPGTPVVPLKPLW